MFNPDPDSSVVRKLKDSLKIPEERGEPEAPGPGPGAAPAEESRKRRHGVGFRGRVRAKRTVEQAKLLSRLSGDSGSKGRKPTRPPKSQPKPEPEPQPQLDPPEESRLGLIFKDLDRKRA